MAAGELVVQVCPTLDDIDPDEWTAATAATSVFYSRAFAAAYQHAPLAPVEDYAYLLVRRRATGRLIGLVPAYLQHTPDPIGCLATAYPEFDGEPVLLTPSWHCYDGRLPAVEQHEELVAAVLDALRDTARRLGARWYGAVCVESAGPTGQALRAAGLAPRYLSVDRFTMDLTPLRDLDHYLSGLSHNARHNARRRARRAAEAGVEVSVCPVEQAGLDELAALCARTAARFGNTRFYRPQTFTPFIRGLGEHATVIEVRERGRLVAGVVCLLDEQRLHAWTGGVDYDVEGLYSPYLIMHTSLVELSLRLGKPVLEGGRSNARFKLRYGFTPRRLDALLLPA